MTATDPTTELAQLAGQPAEAKTYGGRPVAITPLKVREFGPMLKSVEPLFAEIVVLTDVVDPKDIDPEALFSLFSRYTDDVLTAICIAARVEREWLDDQELDVPLDLFADVLAVNRDFFVTRLQPMVTRLQTMFPDGSTSPSASSEPGIATPT